MTVAVEMQTDGMVVVSDRWDAGWKAFLGDREVPVLRVNHAFRGVVVPRGRWNLDFRYEPGSFRHGMQVLVAGVVVAAAWAFLARRGQAYSNGTSTTRLT